MKHKVGIFMAESCFTYLHWDKFIQDSSNGGDIISLLVEGIVYILIGVILILIGLGI